MFTGLTASQYAIRNRDRKDNEPPVIAPGAECEHWECQQAITHKQATVAMPVYGVGCKIEEYRLACDEHAGTDDEESFFCDDCEHEHRQRTSWEPHYTTTEDGEMLCLKCYAERTVNAEGFWITHESQVTVDAVRKAPHLITELIDGLFEIPNTDITVDSMDGAEVVGSMDTIGTFDDVVSKVRRNVADALKTYRRVGLTMPGIYQFAVDLTLVTREEFAR